MNLYRFLFSLALAMLAIAFPLVGYSEEIKTKPISLENADSKKWVLQAEVTGIEGKVLDNVSERLKINLRPAHAQAKYSDVQSFYQKAPEEIKEALKPFGYFKPKVTSKLSRQGRQWKAYFYVDPGPAMPVVDFQIQLTGEGVGDEAFQSLRSKLIGKMRQTLSVIDYEDAKQDLYELATKRGYFQAKIVKSHMLIDLVKYQAKLYIYFNTGPRYYFGHTAFSPSPLADRFLQKFVPFKPGDPYLEEKVAELRSNLYNSNYFQKVSIETQSESLEVPVLVDTKAKKARQYVMGVGWGSDTGARGFLGVNFRRLNSRGHQLRTELYGSQYRDTAKAVYMIPGSNPVTDQYRITAAKEKLTNLNPGYATSERGEIAYLTRFGKWYPTFSLELLHEKFTLTGQPERFEKLLVPSFSIVRAESDDPLRATKGYKVEFNIRGADKSVLGENSFLQTRLDFKSLYTLSKNQRVAFQGAIAYTDINDIFNLPLSLQYYAGGAHSVRGYSFQSIGPGQYFSTASGEFQQRIKGNLFLAVFYDVGSVNNEGFFKEIKQSPGVGLVYLSPLGDIQLDIAFPLDQNPPRKVRSVRVQFSMGSDLFNVGTSE
jgi:translocation and assembly module TamA